LGENKAKLSKKDKNAEINLIVQKDPFSELKSPRIFPLIFNLAMVALLVVAGIVFAVQHGNLDITWSAAIRTNVETKPSLLQFLNDWTWWLGGMIVPLALLLMGIVMYATRSKKVMKYGSLFVASAVVGIAINQLLLALSGYNVPNLDNNSWLSFQTNSFTSFKATIAGFSFALIFCFNSKKTLVYRILAIVTTSAFILFTGFALVATGQNRLSDVVVAILLQYLITIFISKYVLNIREQELYDIYHRVHLPVNSGYRKILKAKAVLNYQEIPYLLKQAKNLLETEIETDQVKKEKGKEVPFLDINLALVDTLVKGIDQFPDNRLQGGLVLEDLSGALEMEVAKPKAAKYYEIVAELIKECKEILRDNKRVALAHLESAMESYQAGIQAAEVEPGDFSYVANKAQTWIGYVKRFQTELAALEKTEGPEFDIFMKNELVYII
jgi:hypothetical protein